MSSILDPTTHLTLFSSILVFSAPPPSSTNRENYADIDIAIPDTQAKSLKLKPNNNKESPH